MSSYVYMKILELQPERYDRGTALLSLGAADRCNGCRARFDICPVGVYAELDEEKKIRFRDQRACFACSACVKQCREDALHLA